MGNLVPEKQVAEILGVSVSTLRRWRSSGVGPAWIKLYGTHGSVRYDLADVQAAIRSCRQTTAAHVTADGVTS